MLFYISHDNSDDDKYNPWDEYDETEEYDPYAVRDSADALLSAIESVDEDFYYDEGLADEHAELENLADALSDLMQDDDREKSEGIIEGLSRQEYAQIIYDAAKQFYDVLDDAVYSAGNFSEKYNLNAWYEYADSLTNKMKEIMDNG